MKKLFYAKYLLITCVVLYGCVNDPEEYQRRSGEIEQVRNTSDADKFFIVDCLLPGQIRKIGREAVYLTARIPIKTSALDCEDQGGEYVAYGQANKATALQQWLPAAQQGNAEAQVYVGEIFAKGQDTPADYNTAAEWYRKAAAQGNSRAQINLGYLYEKGLGVPKDFATATELYKKASGLDKENLDYVATLSTPSDNNTAIVEENKQLKSALQSSREETKALSSQLAANQQQLEQSVQQLKDFQQEQDQTKAKLSIAQLQGNAQEGKRLEKLLQDKNSELASQQQTVANLESQYQKKLAELNSKLEQAESQVKEAQHHLTSQQSSGNNAQAKLLETEAKLASTEKQLLAANESLNQNLLSQAKQSQDQQRLTQMQQQLAANEQDRLKAQATIKQLESQKEKFEQQLKSMQTASAAPAVSGSHKPVIQIIDPPVAMVRGMPIVKLRSSVKERDIIGRVIDPYGIMSLTVNDVKNTLDAQGKFKSAVSIKSEKTPVSIVAINNNGDRQSLDFMLAIDNMLAGDANNNAAPLNIGDLWKGLQFGNYYALIIGNNDYEKLPDLDTPVNDARAVESLLKSKYGFNTQLLLNANRYQILSALNDMRAKLTENDNLLIYYAGHGELNKTNQRGQWLPVDADANNTANWISTIDVTDILNTMNAKHIIVVADSCYSGAMTRTAIPRIEAGLSQQQKLETVKVMIKTKSRTALTSGGEEPVMDGGGGSHSIFAKALIDTLQRNQGLLEAQQLFANVSDVVIPVARDNSVNQVPEYAPIKNAGHDGGEFLFITN